ncbi:interferon regulatory factor 9 isoform X2 [Xenopus laevis]|uniref:Interferon regulatory factor 9 isoform X2 n=1 Tax=Xenopus laevis TaxID=8355 RepID=A0A8J0U8L4_XENLA|nr:interferon regulatory factor 9 isoform X2 [Xenopus laevis]
MATGRARSTLKLKPWLVEQINSGQFSGLVWDDEQKTCFRIPWKHAGKQDFRCDEDAAIFKAWAMYKNRLCSEGKQDAASWKTRLRCALNKSPEFQELPHRSQLDIAEPYKVYSIVPPGEQVTADSRRSGRKRKSNASKAGSSSDESTTCEEKLQIIRLDLTQVNDARVTSSASPEDSGIGSDTSNTETLNTAQYSTESLTPLPTLPLQMTHTALQVTVFYSGVEVSQSIVQSGECKLSAGASLMRSGSGMEHVTLPAPDERLDFETRKRTQDLLTFLQSGVMLASNRDGIFVQRQRSCSGRVFWAGPCANPGQSNKLERDMHVKLFDTVNFLRDLERYNTEGGMAPRYEVTLCFGEEISEHEPRTNKLIVAQIEQVIASELVHEYSQSAQNVQALNPLLQDPPAPYLSPLLPFDTQNN